MSEESVIIITNRAAVSVRYGETYTDATLKSGWRSIATARGKISWNDEA